MEPDKKEYHYAMLGARAKPIEIFVSYSEIGRKTPKQKVWQVVLKPSTIVKGVDESAENRYATQTRVTERN